MICVILGRGRHTSLMEEWRAAADAGAQLAEIRVDCLRRDPDLKRLLTDRPTPVVFTCRRGADGGLWRGPEEKRLKLLREALKATPVTERSSFWRQYIQGDSALSQFARALRPK